ncbi:hypothetical protein LCGC14_2910390, partial [marine sediment metagenome]
LYVKSSTSSIVSLTGIEGAPVTVGTSAVEMTFTGTTKSLFIQADHSNTGTIWVGPSTVDNAGANAFARLEAGEYINIDFDDSSTAIYSVSDTASQKVYKVALT